jgi:hypothetical protein
MSLLLRRDGGFGREEGAKEERTMVSTPVALWKYVVHLAPAEGPAARPVT